MVDGDNPSLRVRNGITTQSNAVECDIAAIIKFDAAFGWICSQQCDTFADNSEIPHIIKGPIESAPWFR